MYTSCSLSEDFFRVSEVAQLSSTTSRTLQASQSVATKPTNVVQPSLAPTSNTHLMVLPDDLLWRWTQEKVQVHQATNHPVGQAGPVQEDIHAVAVEEKHAVGSTITVHLQNVDKHCCKAALEMIQLPWAFSTTSTVREQAWQCLVGGISCQENGSNCTLYHMTESVSSAWWTWSDNPAACGLNHPAGWMLCCSMAVQAVVADLHPTLPAGRMRGCCRGSHVALMPTGPCSTA